MSSLRVVTVATGMYKEGTKGIIIEGGEREVYLGTPAQKFTIPEFKLEFRDEKGRRFYQNGAQYGRDFVFDRLL